MEKAGKKLNIVYAGMQGVYWMDYCMVLSFAAVYLLAKGYSNAEAGVVMAVSNVLALLIQPVIASLTDKSRRVSILGVLWALTAITSVFLSVVYFIDARCALMTASYALVFSLLIVVQPFMTSLTFTAEAWGVHINYGACRAFGSFAFAVMAAVMGTVVEKLGARTVPISALICTVIFVIPLAVFTACDRKNSPVENAAREAPASGILEFFKNNRRFTVFLVGLAFLFATHSMLNNFLILIVNNVGGGSADMGILCAYTALLEVPTMILFDRLTDKFSCSSLLRFSAVMFTVKAFAIFFAKSIGWLYPALFFQTLSFAIYIPASVRYAMLVVDQKDAVKAQTFITLTGTIGSIFSSLLGGVMFDGAGVPVTLLIGAGVSAIGTLLVLLAVVPTARGRG